MGPQNTNAPPRIRPAFYPSPAILFLAMILPAPSPAADLPTIPDDIRQSIRMRVLNGYCPGIIVGIITPQGRQYAACGQIALPPRSPSR